MSSWVALKLTIPPREGRGRSADAVLDLQDVPGDP